MRWSSGADTGAVSALRHAHTRQDEFVYVLHGHPTLRTDEGPTTRTPVGDAGSYPDDDLRAVMVDGAWKFTHKDGTPY